MHDDGSSSMLRLLIQCSRTRHGHFISDSVGSASAKVDQEAYYGSESRAEPCGPKYGSINLNREPDAGTFSTQLTAIALRRSHHAGRPQARHTCVPVSGQDGLRVELTWHLNYKISQQTEWNPPRWDMSTPSVCRDYPQMSCRPGSEGRARARIDPRCR